MHRCKGFARHAELVDQVADSLDVLEEELARVIEVHVGLRRAVDDEREAARHPAVGFDHRSVAAEPEDRGRIFDHRTTLPHSSASRARPSSGDHQLWGIAEMPCCA